MKYARIPIFIITFLCLFFLWNKVITIDRSLSTEIESDAKPDYVLLGSSHMYHGVNPLEIWNQTGYVGYNLGSDLQIPETSYFCLKQYLDQGNTPKVVFFDFLGFTIGDGDPSYNLETASRYHLSTDKIKYLRTVKANERLTMIFPFLKFHSRWKDLNKNDYSFEKNNGTYNFMGYLPFYTTYENDQEDFYPEGQMSADYIPSEKLLAEFEKICKLCEDNNIELVVIKTPSMDWNQVIHSQVKKNFTDANGLEFIDFNDIATEIGFDVETDFADPFHVNDGGSKKLTKYLGEYMEENYDFQDQRNSEVSEIWDTKYNEYIHYTEIYNANLIEDKSDYLEAFTGDKYLVLTTYQGEETVKVTAKINDEIIFQDKDTMSAEATFEYDSHEFYIECTKEKFKKSSKIQVDLQNYSPNSGKTNIVIYDTVFNVVVSTRSY